MSAKKADPKEGNEGQAKDTAGVITHPPPFLYLGGLVIGFGADRLFNLPPLPYPAANLGPALGTGLGIAGLVLLFAAAARFLKAGTNIPTHRPTTALVTDGLYRYSRNPIYVGLTLIYLGLAAAFASLGTLVLLPAVIAVLHVGVIRREERYLEGKFGAAYLDYKARVRRWL